MIAKSVFAAVLAMIPLTLLSAEGSSISEEMCIAANVYFEARAEPVAGMVAVKDVTRNRGGNACKTVFAKHQFSWTAKTPWKKISQFLQDDPQNLRPKDLAAWEKCKEIARSSKSVLTKEYKYFHSIHANPAWTRAGIVIGNHKFIKERK